MPTGGGSIQLGRIFGIRIGVTTSWFLVLFLLIFLLSGSFRDVLGGSDTQAYGVAVGSALLFYASLIFHELGHALAARREGIDVERIDLWFFGGLAQISRQPDTPGAEFRIAAAGPVVTLLVAVGCAAAASVIEGGNSFMDAALLQTGASSSPYFLLLSFTAAMNVLLLAFNLVPAFPLDGGRIALAVAWKATGDRNRATRIAGRMGVAFAYLLIGFGLYLLAVGDVGDGLWCAVLGWILAGSARSAVVSGTVQERLSAVTVADVMDPQPFTFDGDATVLEAREQVFDAHPDWQFVPVVDGEGRFLGVLRREDAEREVAAGRPALAAREALGGDTWSVATDQPLEALLGAQALRAVGAVFAVDHEGHLRGVVTVDMLRRALTPAGSR
jgi:Zn-dependent protease/CBS domain-containing protein